MGKLSQPRKKTANAFRAPGDAATLPELIRFINRPQRIHQSSRNGRHA